MIVCERRCGYLPYGAAGAPVSLSVRGAWLPRAAQGRCAADSYRAGERRLLRHPQPLVLGAEAVPSAARPDRAVASRRVAQHVLAMAARVWHNRSISATTGRSAIGCDH